MDRRIGTRYVSNSQITALYKGSLYYGEDLYLNRKVIFYSAELEAGQSQETYLLKFKHSSSLNHDGFFHILDTSFKERSVLIILQLKPGKPFVEQLNTHHWTFTTAIERVADLGVSILDAMEEQITGFSVSMENLWISETGRISVINYWDEGLPQTQGAIGLCRLFIQLFSRQTEIAGPFEALHTQLERIHIPTATPDQKEALVKLVKFVCQGQASLSTLIFGLRSLQSTTGGLQETKTIPASNKIAEIPYEDKDEDNENKPTRKYVRIGAGAFALLLALFLVWAIWPSSKKEREVSTTPSHSVKPIADSSTPKQTMPQPTHTPEVSDSNSDANKEVLIPNLVGLSQADAEKMALSAGLHYNYLLETSQQPKSTVTKQDPAAGTKGVQGDNVTFWVSKGSQ